MGDRMLTHSMVMSKIAGRLPSFWSSWCLCPTKRWNSPAAMQAAASAMPSTRPSCALRRLSVQTRAQALGSKRAKRSTLKHQTVRMQRLCIRMLNVRHRFRLACAQGWSPLQLTGTGGSAAEALV